MSFKRVNSSCDHRRLIVISVFLFLLFCLLIMQFYKVQIIEGEKWSGQGRSQHEHLVVEPFMRGSFFSNNSLKEGHPEATQAFVMDVLKFHLFIDPEAIPTPWKMPIAEKIFSFCPASSEQEKSKRVLSFFRKSRSRKIVSWLDRNEKEKILQWWFPFAKEHKIVSNAIFFGQDFQRSYPFSSLLGQLLHTVQQERDPTTFQNVPTGGLELYFQKVLSGKLGKRVILRSPRHPLDTGKVIQDPENGADIYLTVNHYLQAIAEEELKVGIEKAHAKGGWALMMDPFTGEILCCAQYPFFDLSRYRDYFNHPDLEEHTRVKAVSDAFEPGSIFKPITLAICFKANEELISQGKAPLFSPQEKVATSNGRVSGRATPIKDGHTHHYLNMFMALQKSSNIYMSKLMQRVVDRMGDEWIRKTLVELFGFGQKTKIQLLGESPGQVPTPGKLHPNGKLEWSLSTPYSLAMGHNILVTSLQMLKNYSMIANGGYEVVPTFVRKIVKRKVGGEEEVLFEHKMDLQKRRRILSSESTKEIIKAMKFVTKPGGTSPWADVMGYTEAGKTGTSEKIVQGTYSHQHYISSFIGITPTLHPRFVLMVVVDEPEVKYIPGMGKSYMGGVCAGPIFSEIAKRALQYLGVVPDDPFGYPLGDPRRDPKKAHWMQEVKEMKELYDRWNGSRS
jgi:cell division protein FtsI (penicillin-binding protein 3)